MGNFTQEPYDVWNHPASVGIRSLFYAVTPGESSFQTELEVPKYVSKATPYFLLLIAIEFTINSLTGHHHKKPRFNDMFSSVSAGVISRLPLIFFRSVEFTAYLWVHKNFRIYELPWDHPLTWIVAMFVVDCGYYWVHRFAHEVNFMWAAHQVHHSSEDYNLTTALRQSLLQPYNSWIFYMPLALFMPPTHFLVHAQFNLLYQFWIHTEVVHKLGPLEWFLNTPSHHRVHHGRNRYCIDKNYAGVFIIWDRMFGTFTPEKEDEEIAYGLVHPLNSWDPNYTQLFYYRYLYRRVKRTKGWLNKLKVLIMGPGWQPGKPRLGVRTDIPDIKKKQPRYNKNVSLAMNLYLHLHFLVSIAASDSLTHNTKYAMFVTSPFYESIDVCTAPDPTQDTPAWLAVTIVVFILWTLTNIGFFYEHKTYAATSELARCCAYLVADGFLCYGGVCSGLLYVPRVIYVMSASLWLVHCARQVKVKGD